MASRDSSSSSERHRYVDIMLVVQHEAQQVRWPADLVETRDNFLALYDEENNLRVWIYPWHVVQAVRYFNG